MVVIGCAYVGPLLKVVPGFSAQLQPFYLVELIPPGHPARSSLPSHGASLLACPSLFQLWNLGSEIFRWAEDSGVLEESNLRGRLRDARGMSKMRWGRSWDPLKSRISLCG